MNYNVFRKLKQCSVVKERSRYDHITPLYFPNCIGHRLKHVFVTRLQFGRSRRFQGNSDPVRVGLISCIPNVRTAFGSRAFRHAAPAVWDSPPSTVTDTVLSLETFKSRLKTFLYNQSFRCWSCHRSASVIRRHRRGHMMRYELFIIIITYCFFTFLCWLLLGNQSINQSIWDRRYYAMQTHIIIYIIYKTTYLKYPYAMSQHYALFASVKCLDYSS